MPGAGGVAAGRPSSVSAMDLGWPGRLMIRQRPRTTAVWRERMAVGTKRRLIWRICSPKPGSSLSATARVASGVTSRGAGPVPPVVSTRSQRSSSASSRRVALMPACSSGIRRVTQATGLRSARVSHCCRAGMPWSVYTPWEARSLTETRPMRTGSNSEAGVGVRMGSSGRGGAGGGGAQGGGAVVGVGAVVVQAFAACQRAGAGGGLALALGLRLQGAAQALEQVAVGAALALGAAVVGGGGRGGRGLLAGVADQGAQLLGVLVGVVGEPLRHGLVGGQQAVAPGLGLVQRQRVLGAAQALRGHGLLQRRSVGLAHELADELQLAAAALVRLDAVGLEQGFAQALGHLDLGQARDGQLQQRLAQRLQVVHVALALRLAGALAVLEGGGGQGRRREGTAGHGGVGWGAGVTAAPARQRAGRTVAGGRWRRTGRRGGPAGARAARATRPRGATSGPPGGAGTGGYDSRHPLPTPAGTPCSHPPPMSHSDALPAHGFAYRREQFQTLVEDALAIARQLGASDAAAEVSEGTGLSVAVRKGEVENVERNRDKSIGVTVYLGQRRGNASTSDFSAAALRQTVQAAYDIARFTAEDPAAGLPEDEDLATAEEAARDLDLFHPWDLATDTAVGLARRCEDAAFATDRRITNSEGAYVSAQQSHFFAGSSRGVRVRYDS